MTIRMHPYAGVADLQRILDLKRACTTPENRYDAPTFSELRTLLAPLPQGPTAARPLWEDEQGRVMRHLYRQAMTQQATMLWEEMDGNLVVYGLIAPPSTVLTFQVHPQVRGSGLEMHIPNIPSVIIGHAVITPDTLAQFSPNQGPGDPYGGAHDLAQSYLFSPLPGQPGHATAVPNLFMLGAATWLGHGINGGSGYIVAQRILNTL